MKKSSSTTSADLGISLKGIADCLSSVKLAVPQYQRAYAWEVDDVNALFADVSAAMEEDAKEYFLGSVLVRSSGQGSAEVVDGQQRLATITFLISAIVKYLNDNGDSKRAAQIRGKYLCSEDLLTQELQPKLSLSHYDNSFYQARVVELPPRSVVATRDSHHRILAAIEAADAHVLRLANGSSDAATLLSRWVLYLHHNAKVIWLEVPDHANAFRIFETLNARGQDLSPADLLKNHIFGRVGEVAVSEAQVQWTQMLSSLESVGGDKTVLTFLRHFWASRNGPTRERELYKSIAEGLDSKKKCQDFCRALVEAADLYAGIISPTPDRWSKHSESARRRMETLNVLRMEQSRPLIVAALREFSAGEMAKLLKYLVATAVRFLVVGGHRGGTMEYVYATAAVSVSTKKARSAADVRDQLAQHVPSDDTFQTAFATARVSLAYLARYYLQTLERQYSNELEPELVPNNNPEEVNLEHILPQTTSAAWGHVSPDAHDAYYNRLGNLALMKSRPNVAAANKSFSEKKKLYGKSRLHLTKRLGRNKQWGPAEIDRRQRELAKLATMAWSLKFN